MDEVSLRSVVLFIACGAMVFLIVFIFAKRQITRFALKSNRGPYTPIGSGAPKSFRQEIDRRLKRVSEIQYEPKLLSESAEQAATTAESCHFLYRMKAVDALSLLDEELHRFSSAINRHPAQNLRAFLLELRQGGPLDSAKLDLVEGFCDAYDHARHDPVPFGFEQYQEYMDFLNKLINCIVTKRMNLKNLGPQPDLLASTPSMRSKHGLEEVLQPSVALEATTLPVEADAMMEEPDDDIQVTYRPSKGDRKKLGALKLSAKDSSESSQFDRSSASGRSLSVSSQGGQSQHSETSV